MPRFRTILVGTLLLGATSVTGATLWTGRHRLLSQDKKSKELTSKQVSDNQTITFTDTIGGKGTTKDGAPYSTHVYKSSDGIVVSILRENQDSARRADKALQRRIKRALRIIEQGPKLDEKGQRVGERVVAMFVLNDKEQATVLWTNHQHLYYIESSSLKHALEFEKQFYKEERTAPF